VSLDAFEPLWLDPQARCLYAALHRGDAAGAATGVVLVPPLLHEQATSRRFLTEVAAGLAAQGVPGLRFDFFGTGDSAGRGEQLDFASMRADLALAIASLRAGTGVSRVVLLVWRGAVLPVAGWLEQGGDADALVLWEPIADGAAWLRELERADASERAERPGYRPGVPCTSDATDGQLMGFPVSAVLRRDLAQARLADGLRSGRVPVWAIAPPAADLPGAITRGWSLPEGAPSFSGGAAMDRTFFLTPPVRQLVDELGQSLREYPWP
jgi:hypothetical protein